MTADPPPPSLADAASIALKTLQSLEWGDIFDGEIVCLSCASFETAGGHHGNCEIAPAISALRAALERHDAAQAALCPECAARTLDDGDWWARQVEKATSLADLKSIAAGWPMSRPAAPAATGSEVDCPHHSETGLVGCGRFAYSCDGCGRVRWIYNAAKGIGSRNDVPKEIHSPAAAHDEGEVERSAVALLADARKCVALCNVNGYYDVWLARCDRVLAAAVAKRAANGAKGA